MGNAAGSRAVWGLRSNAGCFRALSSCFQMQNILDNNADGRFQAPFYNDRPVNNTQDKAVQYCVYRIEYIIILFFRNAAAGKVIFRNRPEICLLYTSLRLDRLTMGPSFSIALIILVDNRQFVNIKIRRSEKNGPAAIQYFVR